MPAYSREYQQPRSGGDMPTSWLTDLERRQRPFIESNGNAVTGLSLIVGIALTLSWIGLTVPVYANEPNETRLVILHTNDLHGHVTPWQGWGGDLAGKTIGGFDRLATVVATARKNGDHVLLLDAATLSPTR
jgi:hypothetical protein